MMKNPAARKITISLCAVAILACAASAVQAQGGPVGHWRGDDGIPPAAFVATDSSGFLHNGIYRQPGTTTSAIAAPLLVPNPSSMSFAGTGGNPFQDQVDVPGFSWPTGGPITVAFWNNVATADIGNYAFAIGGESIPAPDRASAHAPLGDSFLYWDYGVFSGAAPGRISTNYAAYLNKWTHIALVSQGVGGTFKAIYLDGVLVASGVISDGPKTALTGLQIGRYQGNAHKGKLDDFRIYDRVLTAAQIATLAAGNDPVAPTALTATAGINSVTLNWTAAAGATSYSILRSTTTGGPYVQVTGGTTAATTFVDTTASWPSTYFYVVQSVIGTLGSAYSNEASATPLPPAITASPNTGLQTNEAGATTTFNITVQYAVPGGTTIDLTLTSTVPTEGQVSGVGQPMAGTIMFTITGPVAAGTAFVITVTGRDDAIADGPQPYTVTVTSVSANGTFNAVAIPPVQVTNNDNDTPGITLSRTSGLITTELAGPPDTFTVVLNTQPVADVTMSLTSSAPGQGTVAPATLTFTAAAGPNAWNTPHVVTVTGVDDALLDFNIGFTIITGTLVSTDPNYQFDPSDVTAVNVDDETIPLLPQIWGCGLLGAELFLPLGLMALRRRRRRWNAS